MLTTRYDAILPPMAGDCKLSIEMFATYVPYACFSFYRQGDSCNLRWLVDITKKEYETLLQSVAKPGETFAESIKRPEYIAALKEKLHVHCAEVKPEMVAVLQRLTAEQIMCPAPEHDKLDGHNYIIGIHMDSGETIIYFDWDFELPAQFARMGQLINYCVDIAGLDRRFYGCRLREPEKQKCTQ